jgi:cytochrome P450
VAVVRDPWQAHEQQFWLGGQRPGEPVEFKPEPGVWHVYGYPEAARVLGDPATFSAHTIRESAEAEEFTEGNIFQLDPPAHRRMRNLVTHAFTPKVVANLVPRITQLTHELLDAVDGRERLELVADLAYPLPIIVISELLGVPSSDRTLFRKWVDAMFGDRTAPPRTDQSATPGRRRIYDEADRFKSYLGEHVDERRHDPREDLLSELVEAEVDGKRLTDAEIVNFAMGLLVAGHLTTTMLLGNTILCLDRHPEQAAMVRADRSRIPPAIEESLRLLTPVAVVGRITNAGVDLAGHTIAENEMLLVWVAAANRDPRQFTDPHSYDVGRDPNPHLAFGRGIHFCLGAPLARLEGRIALNILLDRFGVLHTDPQAPPEFLANPSLIGLRTLPLLVRRRT